MTERRRRPNDKRLSASTNAIAEGLRGAVLSEYEKLAEEGFDPFYLRYGALTAHIMGMSDVIAASADAEDRAEMREWVKHGGMALLQTVSESVAEYAEQMAKEIKLN